MQYAVLNYLEANLCLTHFYGYLYDNTDYAIYIYIYKLSIKGLLTLKSFWCIIITDCVNKCNYMNYSHKVYYLY